MVRKGSYTVTEGIETPDVPSASDARAVEIDYDKAVQDDQRARNRERNLRLLIIGLILVVILLLAAIIWLLLAHKSKPQHVSDHTTTNELGDSQGRKAGQVTTPFTKPEEHRTSTTTRIVPVIDPGKPKTTRTQPVTSTTRIPLTDSTTAQPDLEPTISTKRTESTQHPLLTTNGDQGLVTTVSTTKQGGTRYSIGTSTDKPAEASSSTSTPRAREGTAETLTTHITDLNDRGGRFYSELTERPTPSTSTSTTTEDPEYADEDSETTTKESTSTTSGTRISEFPISTTGVDKPTNPEDSTVASSSIASSSSVVPIGEIQGNNVFDRTTKIASSIASSATPQAEDYATDPEYFVDPVQESSTTLFLSTADKSTNDDEYGSGGGDYIEQSMKPTISTTSTSASSGTNSGPSSEESVRTGSPSTASSTTTQPTARFDEDSSQGIHNESTTLQETANTADQTVSSQYSSTEGTTSQTTPALAGSSALTSAFRENDYEAVLISTTENATQLSTNSQNSVWELYSSSAVSSEFSSTEILTQSTKGTEATTVHTTPETSPEATTIENLATNRSLGTTEDTWSTTTEAPELSTVPEPEPTTCWDSNCKKAAARMLTWMEHGNGNTTIPESCTDFYRYACEGLISAGGKLQPPEPEEESSRRIMENMNRISSSSSRPLALFQSYYNSCLHFDTDMDLEKRYGEARKLITEVGKFYTEQMWDDSADPTELVAKLILRHSTPLFDIMLDVSKADPSKFALRVTIPIHYSLLGHDNEAFSGQARCLEDLSKSYDPMLDLRVTYDSYVECKKIPVEYLESLEEAIVRLKLLEGWDTFDRNQTRTAVRQDIEMNILQTIDDHKPSADNIRIAVLAKDYQEIPLREMDSKFPGVVSWPKLFQILLNRTLSDDELIQVYFPEYLAKMFKSVVKGLHLKKSARLLNNALLAMYATQVYQEMVAPPYYPMRDLHCLRAASTIMEDVASYLYLQSFSPQDMDKNEQLLKQMFEDIKTTLVEEFQNQREVWNGIALQAMVNKTRLMQASVSSGREVLLDMSRLEDKYSDVPAGLTYIGQSSTLVKKYRKSMYGLYGKSALSEEVIWSHFLLPHSNYGITVYGQNRIVIPFGALHPRFYDPDLPYYLNLARLGSMIGHEMVHAFDKIGIQYSTSKTLWKMVEASESYNASLECLRSQPDGNKESWTLPTSQGEKLITFQHLSELTLNERFADLGGTYLAWKTHRRLTKHDSRNNVVLPWLGMTQDQLFFLANTQMQCSLVPLYQHSITLAEREHLPPELRVDALSKNLEAFSEAFPCLSPLPPEKKRCSAFPAIATAPPQHRNKENTHDNDYYD